ncbi:MAG TPA: hypothetical protein VLZ31_05090, partial [Microbacteriaceae bacterium]|nr:hypothetical protein [Microbacteriaceae bacterium]
PSIKVIALGLAVGVFIDAFIVRMVLVPAVLALLDDRAWRMPRKLQKILPHFDVEGEGLSREIKYREWPEDMPEAIIASENLVVQSNVAQSNAAQSNVAQSNLKVPDLRLDKGEALFLHPSKPETIPLALALSGRGIVSRGTLKALGLIQPDRAGSLRRRSSWADPDSMREALKESPDLLVITGVDDTLSVAAAATMKASLAALAQDSENDDSQLPVLVVLADARHADKILPRHFTPKTIAPDLVGVTERL